MNKNEIDRAHRIVTQHLDSLSLIGEHLTKLAVVDPEDDPAPSFRPVGLWSVGPPLGHRGQAYQGPSARPASVGGRGWSMSNSVQPTHWHRAPETNKGTCSVCGCELRHLGKMQHRRKSPIQGWEKRRATRTGWKITYIGKRERKPGMVATGPTKQTLQRITSGVHMMIQGRSHLEIAAALGIKETHLSWIKRQHSALWDAAYQNAMGDVVAAVKARVATDAILGDPRRFCPASRPGGALAQNKRRGPFSRQRKGHINDTLPRLLRSNLYES